MPLTAKTNVNGNFGFTDRFVGFYVASSVFATGQLDVRSIIFNDVQGALEVNLELYPFSAVVSPFIRVKEFDDLKISTLGTFPVRNKFGVITTSHDEFFGVPYYVNYENQVFPNHHCFVSLDPLPIPDANDAGVPVEIYDLLVNSSTVSNGYPWSASIQPMVAIDSIAYDLTNTVIADIGFLYHAYANYAASEPVNIFIALF